MKEFKGTKEWGKNEGGDNLSIDIILGNDTTISIDRTSRYTGEIVATREEMIANAQLISKAPELLDFINRISGEMLRNDFVLDEKWYDQAEQLIKESTT